MQNTPPPLPPPVPQPLKFMESMQGYHYAGLAIVLFVPLMGLAMGSWLFAIGGTLWLGGFAAVFYFITKTESYTLVSPNGLMIRSRNRHLRHAINNTLIPFSTIASATKGKSPEEVKIKLVCRVQQQLQS